MKLGQNNLTVARKRRLERSRYSVLKAKARKLKPMLSSYLKQTEKRDETVKSVYNYSGLFSFKDNDTNHQGEESKSVESEIKALQDENQRLKSRNKLLELMNTRLEEKVKQLEERTNSYQAAILPDKKGGTAIHATDFARNRRIINSEVYAEEMEPIIANIRRNGATSLREIAQALTDGKFKTRQGKVEWSHTSVGVLLRKIDEIHDRGKTIPAILADKHTAELFPIVDNLIKHGSKTRQQIADSLNDAGYLTREGNSWSHTNVGYLLKQIDKLKELKSSEKKNNSRSL